MKRIVALLLVCLLLAGCSAAPEKSGKEEKPETVDVVLDWYPNAVHAFIYEAIDKGYFADEGLQVNVLFPSNTTDPLTMTAAGKADIGFYYQEDTIIAKANEGVPVKVLGAVVQEPISIMASLKEKNITQPADLVGKTIGYSGTRFAEVAVNQLLQSVGATLDDVEMIDVGFDLMSSMTTGNVDATYGCFINHEIPALEEEGFPMDYMKLTDYGVPNYYALMLVTGEGQLEKNRDKYTRFLRACEKGFDDMQADPDGALQLMMNNQNTENFPLTESVEKKSFDVLLPIMEKEGTPFLSQDAAVWQENIDWLYSTGMIESTFDPAEVMVDLLGE
ncbi:ABC transporter substrate-binding protein [Oscillibacter valericigenes]|uniref:ABC transporter substrate-binding protein n=1 Tax=Oscillibacter valericigenes TaxID=351091 RepID=UPI001F4270F2|nr:ABC transporter substrate-binding protein [Oscillibacter valericigenes]MCF2663257.1 ABC transporter substrate-binding protein [Oscillibacter valericigenes]